MNVPSNLRLSWGYYSRQGDADTNKIQTSLHAYIRTIGSASRPRPSIPPLSPRVAPTV